MIKGRKVLYYDLKPDSERKVLFMILETRKDFEELLYKLLNPLIPYYSEGKAELHLGVTATSYDEKAICLEAFSRPLWALVPFYAGGGEHKEFEEILRKGLSSGTDPKNKEYWGGFHAFDQRFVEMAAIAYGLILIPEKLWQPLTEAEKDNLAAWLNGINHYPLPVCNWILFAVLVNIALKKLGRDYDAEKLETYLNGLEQFYLGEGWYQDGDSGQKDYYVSFAIHFYSLFYAKVMKEEDSKRSELYKERAEIFAKQFIYWFDEDGSAIPFGRSLAYRFAQVSFFSACLMADIAPFSMGVMKGLIARHLNYWMDKQIFDREGILTIGYEYPNLIMGERYNGPGSPYWSLKTFAVLMLEKDHPFWHTKAEPLPELEDIKALTYADMLVARYQNHVTAYVPGKYSPFGHGQIAAKYSKFAYDTKFGFSISKSNYEIYEACPDSMLAFVINGYVYVRRICEEFKVNDKSVYSKWVPFPGITVETEIIPTGNGHIRKHRIESEVKCQAYDCGFSVAVNLSDEPEREETNTYSQVKNKYSLCNVTDATGKGIGKIIGADPNTNIIHPKTLIPAVLHEIQKGSNYIETIVNAEIWN